MITNKVVTDVLVVMTPVVVCAVCKFYANVLGCNKLNMDMSMGKTAFQI